jgi:hypothetical protein
MRTINMGTIINAIVVTGYFGISSLALSACQKNDQKNDDHTLTKPKSSYEGDRDGPHEDRGIGNDDKDKDKGTDKRACGGIGGLQCPDGLTCVDDPSDTCNPEQGGADCMGMCVKSEVKKCDFTADPAKTYVGQSRETCATMKFVCEAGKEYFADDCGCGCMTTGGMKNQ